MFLFFTEHRGLCLLTRISDMVQYEMVQYKFYFYLLYVGISPEKLVYINKQMRSFATVILLDSFNILLII